MSQWVRQGLRTGTKTSPYPAQPDTSPGVTPGLPQGGTFAPGAAELLASRCPSGAITARNGQVVVDPGRCIHSYRCTRQISSPLAFSRDYEWTLAASTDHHGGRLGKPFTRSVHLIVVDAGDCGACLNEVRQLNSPYYNMHRLGFFITPTPRHADILLVVGPVTDQMRAPLLKTYEAMPTPKKVIAVGTCAVSGGIFGPSFVSEAGVARVLPVDIAVPGQPPPPLAILHALLTAVGRKAVRTAPVHQSVADEKEHHGV